MKDKDNKNIETKPVNETVLEEVNGGAADRGMDTNLAAGDLTTNRKDFPGGNSEIFND